MEHRDTEDVLEWVMGLVWTICVVSAAADVQPTNRPPPSPLFPLLVRCSCARLDGNVSFYHQEFRRQGVPVRSISGLRKDGLTLSVKSYEGMEVRDAAVEYAPRV